MTTNDNEWCNEWQRMKTSDTTNDNKWQPMTTSDNEWLRMTECQRITTSGTANVNEWHNEWEQMKANESNFRFQNKTIMRCITIIYSATSFWKCNVKQNICRSSSMKKLLSKISHYSQKNCRRPATLLKRDSNTSAFLWILRNF